VTAPPLPWQDGQWRRLMQALAADRFPHALLLRGPRGIGKQRFASRLAQALLCRAVAPGEGPCGECRDCRLVETGAHPDTMHLERAEDRRDITVDQVRELIASLALTARAGGRKVALVVGAEDLNHHAANTLLKTLEEPPGRATFLLLTVAPGRLPATVRSRCQGLDFPAVRFAVAAPWLASRIPEDADPAGLLAAAAGAPLAAVEMVETGALARRREIRASALAVLVGRAAPLEVAARWVPLGAEEVATVVASLLGDVARRSVGAAARLPTGPEEEALHDLARRIDSAGVHGLADACVAIRRAVFDRANLNEQLALEDLAVRLLRAASPGR
jgi:DNA polymerase III subunit delta'